MLNEVVVVVVVIVEVEVVSVVAVVLVSDKGDSEPNQYVVLNLDSGNSDDEFETDSSLIGLQFVHRT